jgi:hypothetical protein
MSRILSILVCIATLESFAAFTGAETPLPLEALRGAPESIHIDGVVMQLEAQAWRDFMPGSVSDADTQSPESAVPGKPMIAALRVIARNGLQIPRGIRVDVAWVIWGGRVWQSQPEEQPREPAAHEVAVTMRNGPKWPPRAVVDIVVRIVDVHGAAHLLASRNQTIKAST